MQEFNVGDRVKLKETVVGVYGGEELDYGTVVHPLSLYTAVGDGDIPVHFDNYDYDYIEARASSGIGRLSGEGWDFHSFPPDKFELVYTASPEWEI